MKSSQAKCHLKTRRVKRPPLHKSPEYLRRDHRLAAVAGAKQDGVTIHYPLALSREAWKELDVLCLKAMHFDPSQRYASAEALVRDIDHFLHKEPLEARPDSFLYVTRKFIQRNRIPVIAVALSVAILIGAGTAFILGLNRARNAELAEAKRAERIQKFTMSLFDSNDRVAGASENLSVVSLVDRGTREAEGLNQDPRVQADLYQTLGTMYQNLGQLDKADTLMEKALQIRQQLPSEPALSLADNRITLGLLRADENRPDDAERLVTQAVDSIREAAPSNTMLFARAQSALGEVLVAKGKYSDGINLLKQAASVQEKQIPPTANYAETLSTMAETYIYLGNNDEADAINLRLLPVARQVYGADDPRLSDILSNLGETAESRGQYMKGRVLRKRLHQNCGGVVRQRSSRRRQLHHHPRWHIDLREEIRRSRRIVETGPCNPRKDLRHEQSSCCLRPESVGIPR